MSSMIHKYSGAAITDFTIRREIDQASVLMADLNTSTLSAHRDQSTQPLQGGFRLFAPFLSQSQLLHHSNVKYKGKTCLLVLGPTSTIPGWGRGFDSA